MNPGPLNLALRAGKHAGFIFGNFLNGNLLLNTKECQINCRSKECIFAEDNRGCTYSTSVVVLVMVLVAESELFKYTLWLCF